MLIQFSVNVAKFIDYESISAIKQLYSSTDPSQGVWLTGDLTNHNAESVILSDKQIRQKSRLIKMSIHVYFVL